MKSKFTYIYHKAFHKIKPIVLLNTLLYYPDLNKQLFIHKYDVYCHLGSIITQEGKPIYLYIRIINIPQKTLYGKGKVTTNQH